MSYAGITDLNQFLTQLGTNIAKSNLFGCSNVEQGYVLAMECVARRMPPMQIAESYHLIHGRLSKKAEAMLAEFRESGGSHKILERSPDCVKIELSGADNSTNQVFSLTWQECLAEPFVYAGREDDVIAKLQTEATRKKLKLKAKYATPRSRTQMMWARVVSDAVRAFAPEIVAGSYSPEEISDFAGPAAENLPQRQAALIPAVVRSPGQGSNAPRDNGYLDGLDGRSNAQQIADITDAYIRLQVPAAKQQELLTKRGARSLEGLSQQQAADLLIALEAVERSAAEAEGNNETSEALEGEARETELIKLRSTLREASAEVREEFESQIKSKGLTLETLSADQVTRSIESIGVGELRRFF